MPRKKKPGEAVRRLNDYLRSPRHIVEVLDENDNPAGWQLSGRRGKASKQFPFERLYSDAADEYVKQLTHPQGRELRLPRAIVVEPRLSTVRRLASGKRRWRAKNDRKQRIIELTKKHLKRGNAPHELAGIIAARLGCSSKTVREVLQACGILQRRPASTKKRKLPKG